MLRETSRELTVEPSTDGSPVIGWALVDAAPGARVLLAPGVYREPVHIDHDVEIVGAGEPGEVVLEVEGETCVESAARRASVRGLTIRATASATGACGCGVLVHGGRLELDGCDVTSERSSGVSVAGEAECIVRSCRVHDPGECGLVFRERSRGLVVDSDVLRPGRGRTAGVFVASGADPLVRRCRILDGGDYGVCVEAAGGRFEQCEIRGHADTEVLLRADAHPVLVDCSIGGAPGQHDRGTGVWAERGALATLERCDVYGSRGDGIVLRPGAEVVVRGCTVRQNGGAGVLIEAAASARLESCNLTGNGGGPFANHGGHVAGRDNRTDGEEVVPGGVPSRLPASWSGSPSACDSYLPGLEHERSFANVYFSDLGTMLRLVREFAAGRLGGWRRLEDLPAASGMGIVLRFATTERRRVPLRSILSGLDGEDADEPACMAEVRYELECRFALSSSSPRGVDLALRAVEHVDPDGRHAMLGLGGRLAAPSVLYGDDFAGQGLDRFLVGRLVPGG